MTILMTSDMPGVTQEGYEAMAGALSQLLATTPGFIAHVAGPVPGGFRVDGRIFRMDGQSQTLLARLWKCRPAGGVRRLQVDHIRDDVLGDPQADPAAIRKAVSRLGKLLERRGIPFECGCHIRGSDPQNHVWLQDMRISFL